MNSEHHAFPDFLGLAIALTSADPSTRTFEIACRGRDYRVVKMPSADLTKQGACYKVDVGDSRRTTCFLKVSKRLEPIEREFQALTLLEQVRPAHFRVPRVIQFSGDKCPDTPVHWLAIEGLGEDNSASARPVPIDSAAKALAELCAKQPPLSFTAAGLNLALPPRRQLRELLLSRLLAMAAMREHSLVDAPPDRLLGQRTLVIGAIRKLRHLLPSSDLGGITFNHGDFHPHNLLRPRGDPEAVPCIIDWEDSGLNTPLADAAHFVGFVTQSEALRFLRSYTSALASFGVRPPRAARQTCLLLSTLYVLRHIRASSDADTKARWLRRLAELDSVIV